MLQILTANLIGKPQYKILNERRHLVVPLSMIVPGVLNGSRGPLLYPLEEIQRDHDAWNGMPIVKNHPSDASGSSVSARSPSVLEQFAVGTVFNTTVNGKLAAEGWVDEERGRRIIPEEFAKLERGEPVELSTGIFTDNEPVKNGKAVHTDGKEYVAIARNYRPDHLAIITGGSKGACSIKDGCGMNVNQDSGDSKDDCKEWDNGDTSGRKPRTENDEPIDEQLNNYVDWDEATNNQLSHSDLRERLSRALKERHGRRCEIADVYDKTVVYTYPAMDYDATAKFYELGYSTDLRGSKVSLSDQAPREVVREVSYKPVTNESNKQWFELLARNDADGVQSDDEQSGATKKCKCGGTCEKCTKVEPLIENAGGNCGIGAGGFQPGNKCATGGGKGSGKGGGGGSLTDRSKYGSAKVGDTVEVAGKPRKVIEVKPMGTTHVALTVEGVEGRPTKIGSYKIVENRLTNDEQSGPTKKCDCENGNCEKCAKAVLLKKRNRKVKPGQQFTKKARVNNALPSMEVDITPDKACKILKDGAVHGKSLTKAQRGMFGAICGKRKKKRTSNKSLTLVVNNSEGDMALTAEQKQEIVDDLVTNCECWEEADRNALNALPEDKLQRIYNQSVHYRELLKNVDPEDEDEEDEDEEEMRMPPRKRKKATKNEEPVVNAAPRKKTKEEWLADAPDEIRSAVNNALEFESVQKEKLVSNIRKLSPRRTTKQLATWTVPELREEYESLQEAIRNAGGKTTNSEQSVDFPDIPNYAGVPGFVQNLGEDFAKEDLDMACDDYWEPSTK